MTDYSEQPDIMAIGDSMYQGIRSLSLLPEMMRWSPPAQVAHAIGMAMTLPDLQHPLLFDMEAELRSGGMLNLVTHIRDVCVADLRNWDMQQPWSRHQAFDNVAIGGADIGTLATDTYDTYAAQIPVQIAKLTTPGLPIAELATAVGTLWFALNTCYTLNPQHRTQQTRKSQLDQVEERQPRILLINIGSNEGLFRAGFLGDFSQATLQGVAAIPERLRSIAERLARLPARTERIVFNRLIQPRFIPNLMPNPSHENDFPGTGYYAAYGPRISSTQQAITGEQVRAFDQLVDQVNAAAEDVLRSAIGDRVVFADLYGACAPLDGKHTLGHGLAVPGTHRTLTNKPITPVPFDWLGGLAGLDNMHPTAPGYAAIADAVLDALGDRTIRTDKAAAFAADTLLNNIRGLPFLIAEAELSLLGTLGVFRSQQPQPVTTTPVAA